MKSKLLSLAAALATGLALAGCAGSDPEPGQRSGLAGLADDASREIREELATKNLEVGRGPNGEPKAELSPTGELFIGGKQVELDAAQQALALEYRTRLARVAEEGARVGIEGAALAGKAMTEAAKGIFSGDKTTVEQRIEAEADKVRAAAKVLCDQLPALHASQQALAAAVPEFAPYATMDLEDSSECSEELTAKVE